MTELEKKAEAYVSEKADKGNFDVEKFGKAYFSESSMKQALVKFAEPRENRMAELENKIADIKANCDLAIEGRDIKIQELEKEIEKHKRNDIFLEDCAGYDKKIAKEYTTLQERIKELEKGCEETQELLDKQIEATYKLDKKNAELEQLIEKMKCCGNCRFDYCERSSESIDKDGNRTFHCWNEEKEKYCDVGKNGKYQCWELAD